MKRLLPLLCLALAFSTCLCSAEPKALTAARQEYEQSKAKDPEAARQHYAANLAKLLHGYVNEYRKTGSHDHNEETTALNTELKKLPAPQDIDSKKLRQLLPGIWESPRHEYLYRIKGSYFMLPDEKDTVRGKWRIEKNQLIQALGPEEEHYTIILLDAEHFVYSDKENVYFMARSKK